MSGFTGRRRLLPGPGERSRLIYRPKRHVDHKRDGRRSFTWTDYRELLIAAHQQLGTPIVLVWDNCETHGAPSGQGRVKSAIHRATQDGTTISVSGIARQAGVDRTFLYRHRDLLALIHAAELQPSASDPAAGPPVSLASLQADLANAHARNTRLVTQTRRLERRLSELMGEQTWRESGLGAPAEQEELQGRVSRLEQANTELSARLEEKDAEFEAARAANRELTRALNHKGVADR